MTEQKDGNTDVELDVDEPIELTPQNRASVKNLRGDLNLPSSTEALKSLVEQAFEGKEVVQILQSDVAAGLTAAEAHRRLTLFGANAFDKQSRPSLILIFLAQFTNLIVLMLLIAALVSIGVGEWVEGVSILFIVLLNASIATFTEKSSGDALEALSKLSDPIARVVRDGQQGDVNTVDLVPGDIVVVRAGDLVPADMQLLESRGLKINEMILTGESMDVSKAPKHAAGAHNAPEKEHEPGKEKSLSAPHMVYASTSVTEGEARAIVMLTGMNTRVGAIARLLASSGGKATDQKNTNGSTSNRADTVSQFDVRVDENGRHTLASPRPSALAIQPDGQPAIRCCGRAIAWFHRLTTRKDKRTALEIATQKLGLMMAKVAIATAIFVLVIGIIRGNRDPLFPDSPVWLQSFMLAVSMCISAIPEGLPLVLTICLALGTKTMAKEHALVRRLPAVETLGSASVICSDKTGTLTTGKMTAVAGCTSYGRFTITGAGLTPDGQFSNSRGAAVPPSDPVHSTLWLTTMACNDSDVVFDQITDRWKPIGSPTEVALLVASRKFGLRSPDAAALFPRVDQVPFSSSRKMMVTVHAVADGVPPPARPSPADVPLRAVYDKAQRDGTKYLVFAKGAPNVLYAYCSHMLRADGTLKRLSARKRELLQEKQDKMAEEGLRVLAVCYRPCQSPPPLLQDEAAASPAKIDAWCTTAAGPLNPVPGPKPGLVFVGLVGIMDPPRKGVAEAIQRAREASVRTVMITGDFLKTAIAIGRLIGLLQPGVDVEDTSCDCEKLRPNGQYLAPVDMDELVSQKFVFARARPEDKLEIVKSFQRQGMVCAMTGDGVNDAPALQQADIGVAMGLAGSEVAKSASDMILTDDNFTSIVRAVERGRVIFMNIQRFVMYLIGTNWTQLLVISMCVVAGAPAPLEPLQILFVNLATDGVPAVALSVEGPEADIMQQPPRKRTAPLVHRMIALSIVGHAVILSLVLLVAYFLGLYWFIGTIFTRNMFDESGKLMTVCTVINGNGSFDTVSSPTCVEDGLRLARSMMFLTLTFSETLRPLTARSFTRPLTWQFFRNRALLCALPLTVGLTMLVVFTPGLNDIFHLRNLPWYGWLLVVALVLITVVVDELLKRHVRHASKERRRWVRLFETLQAVMLDTRAVRHHVANIELLHGLKRAVTQELDDDDDDNDGLEQELLEEKEH